MKKKNKPNPFLRVLGILFIIYISLSIASFSGYYENKINEEVTLTEENIKKFERDIKENKEIDINNYIVSKKKDYRGFASNMGDNFSGFVEKLLTEELGKVGNVIKKLFS
ncbi:MAG: hypothetical protein E7158_04120 [Firmicutes bacterium]|nr:hypothetical protein [Bacillota bacterium]